MRYIFNPYLTDKIYNSLKGNRLIFQKNSMVAKKLHNQVRQVSNRGLKILFISFSIFMTLVVVQNANGKEDSVFNKIGVEVGNLAPDFNLPSLKGQSVSLRDYKGKEVLLSFGTTWCPYCIKEIPELKNIYKNIPGVTVIYIDIKESQAKVEALVKKYEIPYLVLLDKDASIAFKYKVVGVPTVLLIDKKGIIRYRGNVIPENLEDLLKAE